MPASILTNYGKANLVSAYYCGTTPDGAALPTNLYIILIDNTFTGWAGTTDPDIENISAVTGAINPSNYSGNTLTRTNASGGFTFTKDLVNDRAVVTFHTNPVITAVNALTNVRGYCICSANSIASGKIEVFQRFDSTYSISATNTGTINGAQLLVS